MDSGYSGERRGDAGQEEERRGDAGEGERREDVFEGERRAETREGGLEERVREEAPVAPTVAARVESLERQASVGRPSVVTAAGRGALTGQMMRELWADEEADEYKEALEEAATLAAAQGAEQLATSLTLAAAGSTTTRTVSPTVTTTVTNPVPGQTTVAAPSPASKASLQPATMIDPMTGLTIQPTGVPSPKTTTSQAPVQTVSDPRIKTEVKDEMALRGGYTTVPSVPSGAQGAPQRPSLDSLDLYEAMIAAGYEPGNLTPDFPEAVTPPKRSPSGFIAQYTGKEVRGQNKPTFGWNWKQKAGLDFFDSNRATYAGYGGPAAVKPEPLTVGYQMDRAQDPRTSASTEAQRVMMDQYAAAVRGSGRLPGNGGLLPPAPSTLGANPAPGYSNSLPNYGTGQPAYGATRAAPFAPGSQAAFTSSGQTMYTTRALPAYASGNQPAYAQSGQPAYSTGGPPAYPMSGQPAYNANLAAGQPYYAPGGPQPSGGHGQLTLPSHYPPSAARSGAMVPTPYTRMSELDLSRLEAHKVKVLPLFYGDKCTVEKARGYWELFESHTAGLPDKSRLLIFQQKLRGPMFERWWNNSSIRSFDTLRIRFHNQFLSQTSDQLWERLQTTKRERGESVEEWGDRVTELCESMDYPNSQMRYQLFRRGLRNKRMLATLDSSPANDIPEACEWLMFKDMHRPIEEDDEFLDEAPAAGKPSPVTASLDAMTQTFRDFMETQRQWQAQQAQQLWQAPRSPRNRSPSVNMTTTSAPVGSGRSPESGRPFRGISMEADSRTQEGVPVCGRCGYKGHGRVTCKRAMMDCLRCGQMGHVRVECDNGGHAGTGGNRYPGQRNNTCFFCQQQGHMVTNCPTMQSLRAMAAPKQAPAPQQ